MNLRKNRLSVLMLLGLILVRYHIKANLYTIELQNFRICFGDMLTFISPYMEYFIAFFIVVANFSNPENFVILSK